MTIEKFNMWVSGWCLAFFLTALMVGEYFSAVICLILAFLNFIVGYHDNKRK